MIRAARKSPIKIVSIALCLAIFAGQALFVVPKSASAQLPVTDVAGTVQNTISAIANTSSSVSTQSINYKELVLDPIAYGIAKSILRNVTTSIVGWINSGFEGSPGFLSNPAGFFRDTASEMIGSFIAADSDLQFLCSPFSINVRLSLAFKYTPFQKRVVCTLDDVIRNSRDAVAGASINGFTAGDFKQGGWPAFVSLSTEPQNNVYGAYIEAESELDARIRSYFFYKNKELDQGKGFLSYNKCEDVTVQVDSNPYTGQEQSINRADNTYQDGKTFTRDRKNSEGKTVQQRCQVYTPGSVIAGGLETSLGSPVRQLELADEFNEIVNALFAQLLKQVLTKGLGSVSGSGPSDPNSYLNQVNHETDANLKSTIAEINRNIDKLIVQENAYKREVQSNLLIIDNKEKAYRAAIACFNTKLNMPGKTELIKSELRARMREIDALIASKIAPEKVRVLNNASLAETNIATLNSIKIDVKNASSTEALRPIAELYYNLVASDLHTARDTVEERTTERTRINEYLASISPTVVQLDTECKNY